MGNTSIGQSSSSETINLLDTVITVEDRKMTVGGEHIFLNVHEDEQTSLEALAAFIEITPIDFFYLHHQGTRRISFMDGKKKYSIDPNRIYTGIGRWKTFRDGGRFSFKANRAVKALSESILKRVQGFKSVIAVHNNTDVNYSIKSYLPGGDEAKNTAQVYVNEANDPDDFIYTTDSRFFDAYKSRGVNVILQDNKKYVNDGSLSVYCGTHGIPYINIETQKGHLEEQIRLLGLTYEIIHEI